MKFEGEVGEIELIPRLVELGREKFTGALRFENDAIIKIIYFKEGDILSASTNDRSDSIDEILLKAGKVTRDHLKQALSKRKESETLGDALLNLGFITRKELTWARRVQVIGIIRSIQQWTAGSYTLVADYLPKREEGTLFSLAQIILELLLTEPDRARLDPTIVSGGAVFARTAEFDQYYPELGLNQEADTILTTVDGRRNASEVVEASSSDAFNVYKLLQALEYLGLIHRTEAQVIPELSGRTEQIEWNEPLPPLPSESPASTVVMPLYEPEAPLAFEYDADLPLNRTLAVSENDYISDSAIMPPEPDEVPVHAKAMFGQGAREKRSMRPLIALIFLALSAAAAYAAYRYLHQAGSSEEGVSAPRRKAAVTNVATETGTTASAATSTMENTASVANSPALTFPEGAPTTKALPPNTIINQTPAAVSSTPAAVTSSTVASTAPSPRPGRSPKPAPTDTRLRDIPPASVASASRPPAVSTPASSTDDGSIPSPAPVRIASAPPSGDLKQKYDAMARTNESQLSSAAFTLQFELVCRPESIRKALEAGGSRIWFVPVSYRGGSCYRVFWGKYSTRAEAEAASSQIPAVLRESKPVVVNLKALRGN